MIAVSASSTSVVNQFSLWLCMLYFGPFSKSFNSLFVNKLLVLFTTLGKNVWATVSVFEFGLVYLVCCQGSCILVVRSFLVFLRWFGECRAMCSPRCWLVKCAGGISGDSVVFSCIDI